MRAEGTPISALLGRRPVLVALLAYLVLAVLFFLPGLFPGHTLSAADYLWGVAPWKAFAPASVPVAHTIPARYGSNPQLVDGVTVFEPFLQYTKSILPHIPLWDPYIMGGMPYLADMQSAVFSPFSLPAYIFPFWSSLAVIAVAKVVVAAMGTFLLARALKGGFAGAFLAGIVFGFGLFMVAWIPWPLTNVFPLIPWMLLATEHVVRRPGLLSGAGLATVMALQLFGGHPESSMQATFLTAGYFVLRTAQASARAVRARDELPGGRGAWAFAFLSASARPIGAFAAAMLLGTAMDAVVALPFLQLLHDSADLTARPRSQVRVAPKYFFAAFLPAYFPGMFEIVTAFYAGAMTLVLAAISLLRPTVGRVAAALAGLVTVLIVLGIPPLFTIAARTPGLDYTYLSRFTIVYLLCVALLAGCGLEDFLAGGWLRSRKLAASGLALAIFALPVSVVAVKGKTSLHDLGRAVHDAWYLMGVDKLSTGPPLGVVHLGALVIWICAAGAALLLVWLRLAGMIPASVFAGIAVLLVVADLFHAGFDYNPGIPVRNARQPTTGAIRYLQHQGLAREVALTPFFHLDPLPPDVNLRYGLYDLRGYDLPVVKRFGVMWSRYVAPPNILLPLDTPDVPVSPSGSLSRQTMNILSLYGVKDLLEPPGQPSLRARGVRLVYHGRDADIYENTAALPRAFIVYDQNVVPTSGAALRSLVSDNFDARRVLVTETALLGLRRTSASGAGPGAIGNSAGPASSARITAYAPERVTIRAHTSRPGELVLSDTYYPGWTATVDGRAEPIKEVDYLLRGVHVPAGTSRIVFSYAPATFTEGWIVSLAATMVLLAAVVLGLVRGRRTSRPDVVTAQQLPPHRLGPP